MAADLFRLPVVRRAGDRTKLRDKVLPELRAPILFVQGAQDNLSPLELLENVGKKMIAPSHLYVVPGGDHSLVVSKTELKAKALSQQDVDLQAIEAVSADEKFAAAREDELNSRLSRLLQANADRFQQPRT